MPIGMSRSIGVTPKADRIGSVPTLTMWDTIGNYTEQRDPVNREPTQSAVMVLNKQLP